MTPWSLPNVLLVVHGAMCTWNDGRSWVGVRAPNALGPGKQGGNGSNSRSLGVEDEYTETCVKVGIKRKSFDQGSLSMLLIPSMPLYSNSSFQISLNEISFLKSSLEASQCLPQAVFLPYLYRKRRQSKPTPYTPQPRPFVWSVLWIGGHGKEKKKKRKKAPLTL